MIGDISQVDLDFLPMPALLPVYMLVSGYCFRNNSISIFSHQILNMKHIFILSSFLLLCVSSFAQIHKGSKLLGGSIGFLTNKGHYTNTINPSFVKVRSYLLSPSVGFTLKENTILGIGFTYSKSSQKSDSYKNITEGYGGTVYYRKYLNLGKNFLMYGEGLAGYEKLENKFFSLNNINQKEIQSIHSIYVSAGMAYLAGKRFILEINLNRIAGFGYSETETIHPSNPQFNNKRKSWEAMGSISGSSGLGIGFRFLLGN